MATVVQIDKTKESGIRRRSAKAPAAISPQIKSWIDNVIVPGMVEEFLSTLTQRITVAEKSGSVVISHTNGVTKAEGIQ